MKQTKLMVSVLCLALLASSCSTIQNMNNTAKGGAVGGAGGAAIGAGIGALAGKGKGALIGGLIGAAVGTGAGVLIGNRMDKAAKAAKQIENAQTEVLQDANGVKYVKVTFDSGLLFGTGSSTLSETAKADLQKFATTVLAQNTDMDVAIIGHTDNQGWKGLSATASKTKNQELSLQRAQAVNSQLVNYLINNNSSTSMLKSVTGQGEDAPVASNSTAAGREQNRRVEIYLLASEAMVKSANEQAK